MKRIIIFFIITILSLAFLQAAEPVAFTLKAVGDVNLTRDENSSKVKNGMELLNQDELESKEDSYAAIKFIDGSSVIKLFPRSILTIKTEEGADKKLKKSSYLKAGEIWAKVSKKSGEFEIDTPTTVVSVKGTRFHVKVDETGTTVNTFEGAVEMKNKNDDKAATVGAGQSGSSQGTGEIDVQDEDEQNEDDYVESEDEETGNKVLELKLGNADGDTKTIKIEFE